MAQVDCADYAGYAGYAGSRTTRMGTGCSSTAKTMGILAATTRSGCGWEQQQQHYSRYVPIAPAGERTHRSRWKTYVVPTYSSVFLSFFHPWSSLSISSAVVAKQDRGQKFEGHAIWRSCPFSVAHKYCRLTLVTSPPCLPGTISHSLPQCP